ncbi:MAG: hypothetical protein HZY74_02575 [Brevundimonas sp.]|nr:MAG: hypothetical protein HZY74_02575 [Brevundimonas sp.]
MPSRGADQRPYLPDYRPDLADGCAAEGGVFTITLAEIAGGVDDQVSGIRGK